MSTTDEIMRLAYDYATLRGDTAVLNARATLLKAVEALAVDAARYQFLLAGTDASGPYNAELRGRPLADGPA
jgi:hypothetical protein